MSESLILIGKPTPAALEPMAVRLQAMGYSLKVVADGTQALDMLETLKPRAVLIDVATPEVNGIEACNLLNESMTPRVPIIALNQDETVLRHAAQVAGADLVLDEPLNWTDLCNWLASPHTADGHALATGALMGRSVEDVVGATSLLSHDLKSPIGVIISSLEVLLTFVDDDELSESTQRLLQGALNAAHRQLNLVSTLVDLPRLELGCYDLLKVEFDLAQTVCAGIEKERYSLEIKGLNLQVDVPESPVLVRADHDLIERVLSALIDSVIKFTVRGDDLRITLQQTGQQAMLTFSDTGRPIQPGFEQDIMKRAPQWERRQTGARTSVALSLPFVYAVAQAHQGTFTAQSSDDGKRTTFTFSLPMSG